MSLRKEIELASRKIETEWRILIDYSPAASGRSDSTLQALLDAGKCASSMFRNDCDDSTIQIRPQGSGQWQAVDAAW